MGKNKEPLMSKDELHEVGAWSDKAKTAKGGIVTHEVPDVSRIKKNCCDKFMGEKCQCISAKNAGKKRIN